MKEIIKRNCVNKIGQFALEALLYEAALSPKPGLVDPISAGAHTDMNFFTFIDSSHALAPYFVEYIETGMNHEGEPKQLFQKIRRIGQKAEQAMLKKTGGINTHKGANFSLALLLSATGRILQQNEWRLPFSAEMLTTIFDYIAKMCADLIHQDFTQLNPKEVLTYGESLYLNYGILGIRGEAEAGYPTLQTIALPYLRQSQTIDNACFLLLLLQLMSEIEDSNLIHRGGILGWQQVQQEAKKIVHLHSNERSDKFLEQALSQFDQQLIKDNLSPGGAADLLALSYFCGKLEGLY